MVTNVCYSAVISATQHISPYMFTGGPDIVSNSLAREAMGDNSHRSLLSNIRYQVHGF